MVETTSFDEFFLNYYGRSFFDNLISVDDRVNFGEDIDYRTHEKTLLDLVSREFEILSILNDKPEYQDKINMGIRKAINKYMLDPQNLDYRDKLITRLDQMRKRLDE